MPALIGRAPEQLGLPRVQQQLITSIPAGDDVDTLRNFQRTSVNVSRRARAVNLSVVGILVRRKAMLQNYCSKVRDIQYE